MKYIVFIHPSSPPGGKIASLGSSTSGSSRTSARWIDRFQQPILALRWQMDYIHDSIEDPIANHEGYHSRYAHDFQSTIHRWILRSALSSFPPEFFPLPELHLRLSTIHHKLWKMASQAKRTKVGSACERCRRQKLRVVIYHDSVGVCLADPGIV